MVKVLNILQEMVSRRLGLNALSVVRVVSESDNDGKTDECDFGDCGYDGNWRNDDARLMGKLIIEYTSITADRRQQE